MSLSLYYIALSVSFCPSVIPWFILLFWNSFPGYLVLFPVAEVRRKQLLGGESSAHLIIDIYSSGTVVLPGISCRLVPGGGWLCPHPSRSPWRSPPCCSCLSSCPGCSASVAAGLRVKTRLTPVTLEKVSSSGSRRQRSTRDLPSAPPFGSCLRCKPRA